MNYSILCVLALFFSLNSLAQNKKLDSLLHVLNNNKGMNFSEDTSKMSLLAFLGNAYLKKDFDTSYMYHLKAIDYGKSKMKSSTYSKDERLDMNLWVLYVDYLVGFNHYRKDDFEQGYLHGNSVLEKLQALEENVNGKARERLFNIQSRIYLYMATSKIKESKYDDAIALFEIGLKTADKTDDLRSRALMYNNLGVLFKKTGNYKGAIENYINALGIYEKEGDLKGAVNTYTNIGVIFKNLKEYEKALEYYDKSIQISQENDFKLNIAKNLNNKGIVYKDLNRFEEAEDSYLKSIALAIEIGEKSSEISAKINLGILYKHLKKYDESEKILLDVLVLLKSSNDQHEKVTVLLALSDTYLTSDQTSKAGKHLSEALRIAYSIDSDVLRRDVNFHLFRFNEKTGNYAKALGYYKTYIELKDTLSDIDSQKEVMQKELEFNYEKKRMTDSLTNALEIQREREISEVEIEKRNVEIAASTQRQYFLFGGLALLAAFAFIVFNRLRVTRRQKLVIEDQKRIVDTKNREITDSIKYAKRIQDAILPDNVTLQETLKDGFILFQPKDVVSGDFYWMEVANNSIYIAAADCTGHGVPGALVSVVCSNALSKTLFEEGVQETGLILDKTRDLVIERLSKSSDNVQDGMDISMVKLPLNYHELGSFEIEFSGANNPLWIVRSNEAGVAELIEIKGDKEPIGKYAKQTPFTTHRLELLKNDSFYLFSDGFSDQFGGDTIEKRNLGGKKLKSAVFKRYLCESHHLSMDEQHTYLMNVLTTWRGDLEQNDDIVVLGVRI